LRIGRIVLSWLVTAMMVTSCHKSDDSDSPTAPSPPPAAGSVVRYVAIGASDAAGIGSSVPCLLIDCAGGTSYVAVATRQLRSQGYLVTLSNLGVPTAVISRRFQTLAQQYNHQAVSNFIDNELPFVTDDVTLVTIFAGPNEATVITSALGAGAGGSNQAAYIDDQVRAFGQDYTTLITSIKGTAKAARIIVLNVPNLAALPFLTGAPLQQRQAAQRIAVGMTTSVINGFRSMGAVVIDLMCDQRLYQPSIYSSDGFHPNDSGYAILAGEVVRAATSSAYPAPAASCPQMTAVPGA
jgi:lysophospholipase L1-like esterase